jgi:hypothetical protein
MKSSERSKPSVSFTLDKKLVLLVMTVTVIALGITSFMNFDYGKEILKERVKISCWENQP